jgi:hypothetical protein
MGKKQQIKIMLTCILSIFKRTHCLTKSGDASLWIKITNPSYIYQVQEIEEFRYLGAPI